MKIASKSTFATLLVLAALVLNGCLGKDWKAEAEVTNQMQIHENGLTQREVLTDSLVDDAVDQMHDR